MKTFIELIEFFGGIVILLAIGKLLGNFLKLDEYIKINAKAKKK